MRIKNVLSCVLFLLTAQLLFANVKDSTVCNRNDDGTWDPWSKTYYTYDDMDRVDTLLNRKWSGMIWYDLARTTNTYTSSGLMESTAQEEMNGDWIKKNKVIYEYDANGNTTLSKYQQGDANNQWRNYDQTQRTYTTDNKLTMSVYQLWDTISNQWVNMSKDSSVFPNTSSMITFYFKWQSGSWVLNTKYEKEVTSNGEIGSYTSYAYSSNNWVNKNKSICQYNSNDYITENIQQSWNGSTWVNTTRNELDYNNDGYITFTLSQKWVTNAWENIHKRYSEYDSENNKTHDIGYRWKKPANEWLRTDSSSYITPVPGKTKITQYFSFDLLNGTSISNIQECTDYFTFFNSVEGHELANGVSLFPNPATESLTITGMEKEMAMLRIQDITGRNIFQQLVKGDTRTTVNIISLPKGIYFLVLQSTNGNIVAEKFVKE